MTNKIAYDAIADLLSGDYNKECDFEVILNFLEHTTCVIRQLYWSKRVQRDLNYHGKIKTKG
ncbi:MAG TPA: hypothetical protein VI522_01980 [Gammaproteobacteria bacterium]|nr:hypothetical protein [Gammaproteobacteria bacterium]